MEAERIAIAAREEDSLDVRIYRPSVIVGHSESGKCLGYNGYQGVFRALYLLRRIMQDAVGPDFNRNLNLRIAAAPNLHLNMVPIDYVVEAMLRLAASDSDDAPIYNITHPTGNQLSVLFERGINVLGLEGIHLSAGHDFSRLSKSTMEKLFERQMKFQAPYLLQSLSFDTTNYEQAVSDISFHAPTLGDHFLNKMNGFLLRRLDKEHEGAI